MMENEEIAQLKTVYNELWNDVKTMIKDMNKSITTVFLFGLVIFIICPSQIGTEIGMFPKIES